MKREGWKTGHGELNACDKMTHLRLIGYGHALFAGSYLEYFEVSAGKAQNGRSRTLLRSCRISLSLSNNWNVCSPTRYADKYAAPLVSLVN